MPKIKPVCAIRPAKHLVSEVVSRPLEYYGIGQARLIASENPDTFLHLIEPGLDNPYLRGSRQDLIYKKIHDNFENLIERKVLVKDEKAAIFVYQVEHHGRIQTGIWTITQIDDYLNNNIKKHENTVERREKALVEYLNNTGLDANPVLVTYIPDQTINSVIAETLVSKPEFDFNFTDGSHHRLWVINNETQLNKLITAFGDIKTTYIADGHHRAASLADMGVQRRLKNPDYKGDETYNFFTTVYMATNELVIYEFNRLVKDIGDNTPEQFLKILENMFTITACNKEEVKPCALHEFGMYMEGCWYQLLAKPHIYHPEDPVSVLDVTILQDHILNPILHITDPRTDARLGFEGGLTPLATLAEMVDNQTYQVAFTLFPTSIQQLIDIAEAGEVMPPKSTWFEPKFLVGMVTNFFD